MKCTTGQFIQWINQIYEKLNCVLCSALCWIFLHKPSSYVFSTVLPKTTRGNTERASKWDFYLRECIHWFSPVLAFPAPVLAPSPVPALVPSLVPVLFPSLSPSPGVPGHAPSPVPSPNWQQQQLQCEPSDLKKTIMHTTRTCKHINTKTHKDTDTDDLYTHCWQGSRWIGIPLEIGATICSTLRTRSLIIAAL